MTERTVHWPIESVCPYCQSVMDRATLVARTPDVPYDEAPQDGDLTVCIDCAEYGIYYFDGKRLKIRKVTETDLSDFPDGGLVSMVFLQAAIHASKMKTGEANPDAKQPEFVDMAIRIIEGRQQ